MTQRPTRIAFITPDLGPGGAERHIIATAPPLVGPGFEVMVCCLIDEGVQFALLDADRVLALNLAAGPGKRHPLRALGRLTRVLRRWNPDVVITRGPYADVVGRLAASAAGTPVVLGWKHNAGHLGRHGLVERAVERVLSPLTTGHVAVARGQVPYLVRALHLDPARIAVIHNGIDPAPVAGRCGPDVRDRVRAEFRIPPTAPVVSIVAVLREEKDHDTFLRAAERLLREMPDCRFLIAGDGPERARVVTLANDLGISDHVMILGMRTDVPEILCASDVTALSSFTIECFPFSILEAMAAGTPAVATDVGGLAEMIEHGRTGYLVPPRDPGALSAALAGVLARPDRGRAMGAAGRVRLERCFTADMTAERLQRLVTRTLAGPEGKGFVRARRRRPQV